LSLGMFVGFAVGLTGWWLYGQSGRQVDREAERGEIIYRNTPLAD
jgi:hypothetical protein